MIAFRQLKDSESGRDYELLINGVRSGVHAFAYPEQETGELYFGLSIRDDNIARQFLAHSLSEIPPLEHLYVNTDYEDLELIDYISIYRPAELYKITFGAGPDLATWPHPFSFASYCGELEKAVEAERYPGMTFNAYDNNDNQFITSFEISFPLHSTHIPLADQIETQLTILRRLHNKVVVTLLSNQRSNSVVETFSFPEAVRVPCEQYLLYFVDFLKGLGVEATADLQHEAGRVLFAVTPTNKDEALDKIHAALRAYLQLASSPIGDSSDSENELAIQGLLANVDHLKSQLRLSYMMVRAQETTIQAQQVTIASQQRMLSGEVLLDSLNSNTARAKPENKEEVIDGILSLGQYADKGVTVNLGELYRRLKKLFKKDG